MLCQFLNALVFIDLTVKPIATPISRARLLPSQHRCESAPAHQNASPLCCNSAFRPQTPPLPRPSEKTTHCLEAFATKAAFITGVNNEHHSNNKAENATAC